MASAGSLLGRAPCKLRVVSVLAEGRDSMSLVTTSVAAARWMTSVPSPLACSHAHPAPGMAPVKVGGPSDTGRHDKITA
jgi:hypothetical protein